MKDGKFKGLRPEYHPDPYDKCKDLSGPALIFQKDATWYFGDQPQNLPTKLSHLAAAGIGHRVNGASEIDIAAFEKWLRSNWPPGFHGRPRDPGKKGCQRRPC
jgi:hypothetical protein